MHTFLADIPSPPPPPPHYTFRNSRHSGETSWPRKASIQPQQVICRQHSNGTSWFHGFNWVIIWEAFTEVFCCICVFKSFIRILFRYMHYFQSFGFIEESWSLAFGFLVVSVTAALVESHPISTHLDDNLTVPLTSFLVGSLVFWCLPLKENYWEIFWHVRNISIRNFGSNGMNKIAHWYFYQLALCTSLWKRKHYILCTDLARYLKYVKKTTCFLFLPFAP